MGFEAVELEVSGKSPTEFSQPRQQLTRLRALRDLERARAGDVDFNVVAFLQCQGLHNRGGQAHCQAVTPLCDLHGTLRER